MKKQNYDIIFIAGAPGSGKSSVANGLQKILATPCFEFGWIPEFRRRGNKTITYQEEEKIAFENLVLVVKNYIKHKFCNIIITDLEDKRIIELHEHFAKQNYIIFTLIVDDEKTLKSRVMNESRSSKYRDWETAAQINREIIARPLLLNENRINTTKKSIKKIISEIVACIEY